MDSNNKGVSRDRHKSLKARLEREAESLIRGDQAPHIQTKVVHRAVTHGIFRGIVERPYCISRALGPPPSYHPSFHCKDEYSPCHKKGGKTHRHRKWEHSV